MKFKLEVTIEEDDKVRVASANPGQLSPYMIIGLLEQIKTQLVFAVGEEEKDGNELRPA